MTRILIIYEKMGMGHLRAARIMENILTADGVEIVKKTGSELLGSGDIRTTVWFWNLCIRNNWIKAADTALNCAARLLLPLGEIIRIPRGFRELDRLKPDVILCTSDVYGHALGMYAAQRKIPYYLFITDISIFLDLVHPRATHICYFQETADAVRSYDFSAEYFTADISQGASWRNKFRYLIRYFQDYVVKRRLNPIYRNVAPVRPQLNQARTVAIGPLAERKHFFPAHCGDIRRKYKLTAGVSTVLLASGSLGGRFVRDVVRLLHTQLHQPVNLMVICGSDEKTYQELCRFQSSNPNLKLHPIPFTDELEAFLELADCAIIRPSAGIYMESLIHQTPVVACGDAPANDRGTLAMIQKYHLGRIYRTESQLIPALLDVLANKETYVNRIGELLQRYPGSWEEKARLIRLTVLGGTSLNQEMNRK